MRKLNTSIIAVCSIVSLACAGTADRAVPAGDAPDGIVIHLGRADIETLKDLYAEGRFTVQVLDRDAKRIADVRKSISAAGLYGPVSARVLSGDRLPSARSGHGMAEQDRAATGNRGD